MTAEQGADINWLEIHEKLEISEWQAGRYYAGHANYVELGIN